MKWFRDILRSERAGTRSGLFAVQQKFSLFLDLLESNNRALKIMADMELRSQGHYLFNNSYVRASLDRLRSETATIIRCMTGLGGDEYKVLQERYAEIVSDLAKLLPEKRPLSEDAFTIPLAELDRERAWSVGGKNAQLGEMKKLKLPVPDGFAVSAWAYKRFMEGNGLQEKITEYFGSMDLDSYDDLVNAGVKTRSMVTGSPLPEDVARSIRSSYDDLVRRSGSGRVAMRSSAIGEDTRLSFAGQYETFLNVRSDDLLNRYRDVIASKFTPKAIYYLLSHDLAESDLPMSVGCINMVDAAVSGVVYTHDPICAIGECLVVNSVYGLGKYLADGVVMPDVFYVYRLNGSLKDKMLAKKTKRLVISEKGGVVEEAVPATEQDRPSLNEDQLKVLVQYALELEDHYDAPQAIEWAIDRDGRINLLQTRPLRVITPRIPTRLPETDKAITLFHSATAVCPGAGGGPVYHASSPSDLSQVPRGAVLVTPHPFPGLITVLSRLSALVIEYGGLASHIAMIAREFRLPTLAGVAGAGLLPAGQEVTVCATCGKIFQGVLKDLIETLKPDYTQFDDTDLFSQYQGIIAKVLPLNFHHPADPDFKADNCRTIHDITRFCHQRAIEVMFENAAAIQGRDRISLKVKTDIPLQINLIYLDKKPEDLKSIEFVDQDKMDSGPLQAFWNGLRKEGWPVRPSGPGSPSISSVMHEAVVGKNKSDFSEQSFAILSREYLLLSLRMGYHFATIEGMCADEPSKNFIHMQFKEGGSAIDRRIRRVRLIGDVLARAGFENLSNGDFLDASVSYEPARSILDKLFLLGRLTILTKQLDMALSNDSILQWYTEDIIRKLGLDN